MNEAQFKDLLNKQLENQTWPIRYMFKFIVPNQDGKVEKLNGLLPAESEISYKHTPNLQYVSITCVAQMHSAEQIVSITSKAVEIQGVMAL